MDLVKVYGKNEIFCDSLVIAKKFSKQHSKVVRSIESILKTEVNIKGAGNGTLVG